MAAWIALAVVPCGHHVPSWSVTQAAAMKEPQAEAGKVSPSADCAGLPRRPPPRRVFPPRQQAVGCRIQRPPGHPDEDAGPVRQTDPNRAALIEKALKESGERHVEADFQDIVDLLRRDKFGDAARKQGKVNEDLDAILKLLLSEDRSQGILDEKALIRKYLESPQRHHPRPEGRAGPHGRRRGSQIALRRTGRPGPANGQSVEGHRRESGKGPQ